MQPPFHRLVIVANRLPLSLSLENGTLRSAPANSGLVAALEPLLRKQGGYWIGNPGIGESPILAEALSQAAQNRSYEYVPVYLPEEERESYSEGFSDRVIWPLFHDFQSLCSFDPNYWRRYLAVNEKFAIIAERTAGPADLIWIQDYQLMQVAKAIRVRRPTAKLAFLLHTPFPGPDIFAKLPWRSQLLEGMLEHDLVALQTIRDLRNFLSCLHFLPGKVQITKEGNTSVIYHEGRATHTGAFPISIDFEAISHDAQKPLVQAKVAELRQNSSTKVVVSVDRLDFTKGIPERIRAFSVYLRQNRPAHGEVSLYQIVLPGRETIPENQRLQEEIERLVAAVNGEWGRPPWTPIVYLQRPLSLEELLAFYRVADAALITPLKDGMNLVAKEYCAAKNDAGGVLILSEFAGAGVEFDGMALLINPYDEEGVARTIERALSMPDAERRNRMRKLRRQIQRFDLNYWRDVMLSALLRIAASEPAARVASAD
ncbi:MAG TPA: trehalose-6-phosphate synthase [Bryobacteraceae bacterium]|jgi:trehalose 6-phosphate synthase|nr:trehalose-6-phosphate synthase [Bryobacteraceae bacterium]